MNVRSSHYWNWCESIIEGGTLSSEKAQVFCVQCQSSITQKETVLISR